MAEDVQYWQDLQRRRAEEALKRANEELTDSNAQLQKLAADLEAKILSELRTHQELMEAKQRQLSQAEVLAKLGRMSATIADEIDGINASLSKYFFVFDEWIDVAVGPGPEIPKRGTGTRRSGTTRPTQRLRNRRADTATTCEG